MTVRVLLSPTEGALTEKLGDLAIISSVPEQKGADVLIYCKQGLIGLQRKEVPNDFISSFIDGRMTRETSLLIKHCQITRIIGEGKFQYWPDGRALTGQIDPKTKKPMPSRFTRNHIRGMIFDIELVKGITIDWTENTDDTVAYIKDIINFASREKHLGLYSRPAIKGAWYVPTASEVQLWLLQGFQGIGPQTAENIVKHLGKMPLGWTCTFEELRSVPGVSKKKAEEMWAILEGEVPLSSEASGEDLQGRIDEIRKKLGSDG